ncbi:rab-GTPase-TBC domain-containing protein [Gorgonomyces haynaldii]|nr:rab-GTPase-TBC domain-containing protein [Gorgonomyces haynaldii]
MNEYDDIVRKEPRLFTKRLHKGIPEPIRGMMWQLMATSKSEVLESEYLELLQRTTRHDKMITRDLARTFPGHPFFKDPEGPGQTSLYNILKAYSIYDADVGYCQGLPFIVEEQAFCLLTAVMTHYNFRPFYTTKMLGLQLYNYYFDQLMHEKFPETSQHLKKQDIQSSMYASQWFMTVFAYRFPLELVFRIWDIILGEENQDKIKTLDFEPLLDFLKNGLFEPFLENPDRLVELASNIKIQKTRLDKWKKEFEDKVRKESPDFLELMQLKQDQRQMVDDKRKLERQHEQLNQEHVQMANCLIEERQKNEQLLERIEELEEQVKGLKSVLQSDRNHAEDQVKHEMDELAQKNINLANANAVLQDQIHELQERLQTEESERLALKREKQVLAEKLARSFIGQS